MALFGRKKPQELYAEAKKLTDLIYDWLLEPLRQYNFSVSDGVQTEYYLLAICSYLAQEKISPAAREHLHTAIVESSTYGKKYVKDKQKEYGFMAVLLSTFKNEERDARRAKGNVLSALVTTCFRDFSKYEEPDKVKRCVYSTINLFNQEIPTTDYAKLRLEVPAAAQASRTAAPARPAAPAPTTPKKADYTFYKKDTREPIYLDKVANPFAVDGVVYQAAMQQGNPNALLFLDVAKGTIAIDGELCTKLGYRFVELYPEEWSKIEAGMTESSSAPDHPTELTLGDGNGNTRKVKVLGWMDYRGTEYAITTDVQGKKSILVLGRQPDGHLASTDTETARIVFGIFRDRHPAMFK